MILWTKLKRYKKFNLCDYSMEELKIELDNRSIKRLKLDIFALTWIDLNSEHCRSNGSLWVTYRDKLNQNVMKETLISMISKYPILTSKLVKEEENFYFEYMDPVDSNIVERHFKFIKEPLDNFLEKLLMAEINLFKDPLYTIYVIDQKTEFDILIFGAHVMGDGISTASFMSLLIYNYYLKLNNKQIFLPEMRFEQLLDYTENLA